VKDKSSPVSPSFRLLHHNSFLNSLEILKYLTDDGNFDPTEYGLTFPGAFLQRLVVNQRYLVDEGEICRESTKAKVFESNFNLCT
jgi:hypothetical protein